MMCFDELDYMQDCEKGVAGEEINFFFSFWAAGCKNGFPFCDNVKCQMLLSS